MPAFGENAPFFDGLHRARRCLLALSLYGVIALRVRIMPAVPVVIEVDRPLDELGLEVITKSDYSAVTFEGCSVAWKVGAETA